MSLYTKKTARSQLGHLKISLFEDSGALVVTIFEARGLARKNGNPLDTYVKLYLLPDPEKTTKEKTKIVKDKDPRYDERFSFILSPEDYAKRLHISVWAHYSTSRNELIGCMSFLVADLLGANKGVTGWYQLLDKDEGRSNSSRVPAASPGESTVSLPFKNYAVTMAKGAAGYGFSISGSSPVFVTKVEEGLPAYQADIQMGDMLVEVEGTDVTHASGEQIISIIKKCPDELHMILQRPAHQLKQRRQSTPNVPTGPYPWPQSHSQTSSIGGLGSEFNSQPVHVRSLSDQPFVQAQAPPTWSRQASTSREKITCSMDKIVEEEGGGGPGQVDHRPIGRSHYSRRSSAISQSSERSVDGSGLVPSNTRFSLQPQNVSMPALQMRRPSNHSQFSERSLDSQQDQQLPVHTRSRSQPASEGTDEGSDRLSVHNTGSKHTSGSDSEPAIAPPSARHGSFLSLNRRSPAKETADSAYSSGISNLNPKPEAPVALAVKRKGSSIGSGIMEGRDITSAVMDEPVIEWMMLGSIGQKKQKAINNLMNTEFHFCEVLRLGIVTYLDPSRDILLPDQHETIFHDLEELYHLSYDISTQLRARCQPYCSSAPVPSYVESVGSVYHSKLEGLIAAVTSRQNQMTRSHDQVSYCFDHNKAFNTLVENGAQRISLHSFVDATNEYLPKLARFLMGVSYFTPLWHEDHTHLTTIIRALVKVCPNKELTDKWQTDQDTMERLRVRLGFETGIEPFTLVIPGRVLLNEGEVTLIAEKKKKKKIWLMLFSDILVLAKKQGKLLVTMETPFLLEQLTVNDVNCDELEFQLLSVDGKIRRLMRAGRAQEKSEWVLMLKEWTSGTITVSNGISTRTSGTITMSNGISTRTSGTLKTNGASLPANGNSFLSRNGSVSVHKVPSPPKFAASSLTQPDSGSPSEHFVQFSQPAEFAPNVNQSRSRAMTTTAAVRSMKPGPAPDAVEVSHRSLFAGSAGAKPGETKDDSAKDKRRAPPPFTSQRRLGATSTDRPLDTAGVSVKVLQEWEKSFDTLMASPEGIVLFEEFLRSEFSEENIQFWKACEQYSKLPRERMQDAADKIYQEFLCEHSPKLVNLDHQTMTSVLASIKNANPSTFRKAQNSIFMLMASDSYKRFINSDKFQSALR